MTVMKQWHVEIFIDEHDQTTRAEARLRTEDRTHMFGVGRASCRPTDPNVPEIGDELAVARALYELAHQLLDAAARDIEGVTHHPAKVTR
ncbi:DUF1876 domain-containing protein [Kibdelosporangium lantanae]